MARRRGQSRLHRRVPPRAGGESPSRARPTRRGHRSARRASWRSPGSSRSARLQAVRHACRAKPSRPGVRATARATPGVTWSWAEISPGSQWALGEVDQADALLRDVVDAAAAAGERDLEWYARLDRAQRDNRAGGISSDEFLEVTNSAIAVFEELQRSPGNRECATSRRHRRPPTGLVRACGRGDRARDRLRARRQERPCAKRGRARHRPALRADACSRSVAPVQASARARAGERRAGGPRLVLPRRARGDAGPLRRGTQRSPREAGRSTSTWGFACRSSG